MRRCWTMMSLLACGAILLPRAQAAEAQHAILTQIAQTVGILFALANHGEKPTFSVSDQELTASYHTRMYQVYEVSKQGDIGRALHEVTGPEADGFTLRVTVCPGKATPGQADLPQEYREPYWTRYLAAAPLATGDAHLLIDLRYGSRMDKDLLDSVKHLLPALAEYRPLPDGLIARRNRIMADADAQIRRGIADLATRYPQLRKTNNGSLDDVVAEKPREATIGILLGRYHGGKGGTQEPVAEQERYSILVLIHDYPAWGQWMPRSQMSLYGIYQHLDLGGQIQTSAGDPALDAALKKLVQDAVAPLAQLNEEVGAAKAKEQ